MFVVFFLYTNKNLSPTGTEWLGNTPGKVLCVQQVLSSWTSKNHSH